MEAPLPNEIAHEANVAKLRQLANDADAKKAEFANANQDVPVSSARYVDNCKSAAHYAGMRDGFLRAITVLEGRG